MDKRKKTAAAMGRAVLAAGTALYLCSCAVPQIGNGLWGGAPDPSPERVDTGRRAPASWSSTSRSRPEAAPWRAAVFRRQS